MEPEFKINLTYVSSIDVLLLYCLFRYIRIVGTHNTVNRVFHLVSFQSLYTNQPFQLEQGLVGK